MGLAAWWMAECLRYLSIQKDNVDTVKSEAAELFVSGVSSADEEGGGGQNWKQIVLYISNWDKYLAPAICPCIFSAREYWISAGAAPQ